MPKVLHLQFSVPAYGNAPYRLHEAMLDNGIDSSIVAYQTPRAQSERLIRFSGLAKFLRIYAYGLIHKYIRSKIVKNKNLFSFPFVIGNDISKHPALAGADVIYLHWINGGFLSLRNIRQIASMGKPLAFLCMTCGRLRVAATIVLSARVISRPVNIVQCLVEKEGNLCQHYVQREKETIFGSE